MIANRKSFDGYFLNSLNSSNNKPRISEKARQRPVRVIPADDSAEMQAGHLIASGSPFSSSSMISRSTSDSGDHYSGSSFGSEGGLGFGGGSGFNSSEERGARTDFNDPAEAAPDEADRDSRTSFAESAESADDDEQ